MPDEPYRPAHQLVNWMTILLVAYAAINLAALASGWLEIDLLQRAADEEITDAEAEASDRRQALVGLAQLGALIALVVLFCLWIPRANRNARALGATGMRFTPRWCVIWYVIPIMNLFRPYQAMKEIWMASTPADATPWQQRATSPVLGVWWALWLTSNILGQLSFRLTMWAEDLDGYLMASWASFAAGAADIALAIAAMLVVRGIHDMQERSRYTTVFD